MLLDLPRARYDLIASIGQQLPIYLFSNTNHIHITWFNTYLEKQGMSGFFDLFQQAYLSHNVHKRKPDVATFEWVIQQHNLVPETTLFIDDSAQHIEGAQKAGLQTHWLAPHEQIVDLFPDFLA
jgi:putative hydrolase of the HAD superfamily